MPDFIPRADAACLAWSVSYVRQIVADPGRCGFPVQYVPELVAVQAAFEQAMAVASSPDTRTTVAVVNKNAARLAMEAFIRRTAGLVRANLRNDPATLTSLGLMIGPGRNAARRTIGRPTGRPSVFVQQVQGSVVSIRLRNPDAPSRRGMARDLSGAILFSCVGDQPPVSISGWRMHRMTSRTEATLEFGTDNGPGTKVWICAQWTNPRQQAGPLSAAVYTYLAYAAMNSEIVSRLAA